jgi:hypothetical protein
MWLPNGTGTEQPKWNNPIDSIANGGLTTNAFSWGSRSASGTETQPSIPIPWITDNNFSPVVYESLELSISFTGRIAVVYGAGVGELYQPDNRFFLEMRIRGSCSAFLIAETYEPGYYATDSTYTMKLSTGNLSCKLTSASDATLTGNLDHSVTEWWPYAKDNPAVPVWDTATGLPL